MMPQIKQAFLQSLSSYIPKVKKIHTKLTIWAWQFTLYSYAGSQWAGVPLLTLAEKGFDKAEYEIKDVDLSEKTSPP